MENEKEPKLEQDLGDNSRNIVKDDELGDALIIADREARLAKMNLAATRRILYKLMEEGTINAETKLLDVLKVVEDEDAKLDKTV